MWLPFSNLRSGGLGFVGASLVAHIALAGAMGSARTRSEEHADEPMIDLVSEVIHTTQAGPATAPPSAPAATARVAGPRRVTEPSPIEAPLIAPMVPPTPEVIAIVAPTETAIAAAPASTMEAPRAVTAVPSAGPQNGTSASIGGNGQSGASTGGGEGEADAARAFGAHVRARVHAAKRYPRTARDRGLEGSVFVTLEISREGGYRIASIEAADVPAILVTAASDAVRDAAPFPIPPAVTHAPIRIRLHLRFDLTEE